MIWEFVLSFDNYIILIAFSCYWCYFVWVLEWCSSKGSTHFICFYLFVNCILLIVFFFITGAILSEYYDYDLVSAATILSIFYLTRDVNDKTDNRNHYKKKSSFIYVYLDFPIVRFPFLCICSIPIHSSWQIHWRFNICNISIYLFWHIRVFSTKLYAFLGIFCSS